MHPRATGRTRLVEAFTEFVPPAHRRHRPCPRLGKEAPASPESELSGSGWNGRILAAYGGVFVAGLLGWGMAVDGFRPDRWDLTGTLICLLGVSVIM
ncbi:YnfA family protein [Nocardia asteroides]|nr:YnfA family protein [Nocardia asteroides]